MKQTLYKPLSALTFDELTVEEIETEEGATCKILVTVNTYDDPFTSKFQEELPELICQFIIDTQNAYAIAYNAGFHGGMKQAKEEGDSK